MISSSNILGQHLFVLHVLELSVIINATRGFCIRRFVCVFIIINIIYKLTVHIAAKPN